MISIMDAAHYLVYLSYSEIRASLTPLKIQKILYFAQGWSFVWDDKPLFTEDFEAWQFGPVNKSVYMYFQKYGRGCIPEEEGIPTLCDEDAEETLKSVWRDYSKYSAFELVEMTHLQTPWSEAYKNNNTISATNIKNYFQKLYC